jgi:hypothetical protein
MDSDLLLGGWSDRKPGDQDKAGYDALNLQHSCAQGNFRVRHNSS